DPRGRGRSDRGKGDARGADGSKREVCGNVPGADGEIEGHSPHTRPILRAFRREISPLCAKNGRLRGSRKEFGFSELRRAAARKPFGLSRFGAFAPYPSDSSRLSERNLSSLREKWPVARLIG